MPEIFQILYSDTFIVEFSTTFFKEDPFQLMICGKKYFDKHDSCGINTNRDKYYTFFGLSRHEKVNIEKDESQDSVIEQPISNKRHFFDKISLHSFPIVTLCPPRNIINITKSVDQHNMRICSLIDHITDAIPEQFKDKGSMCR